VARSSLSIVYSFPLKLGTPGIGAAALSQVRAMAELGWGVHVFCWSTPEWLPGVQFYETRKVFHVPARVLGIMRACRLHDFLTARALKGWDKPPDLVHTWPLGGELTLRLARELGILGVREAPNTHTAHAFEVVEREHRSLGLQQSKANPHTFNAAKLKREIREYALADLILVPSELALRTFAEQGVPEHKLALKSYGFDPAHYRGPARSRGPREITFGFVASCEPRKGLHHALAAWHRSGVAERTRFTITGTYVPGYRERLLPLLQHKNVSESPFASDLRPIYQATDVLVLPSIEEGSALVTYEAQASGCALLVSEAAGARLTSGREGFVHEPGDVDTLARQMRTLADEPDLLATMQETAVVNAQQYTWANATADLVRAYEAALQGRRC
jgi:glycosyltransferase involved in cell wall biosynthesis